MSTSLLGKHSIFNNMTDRRLEGSNNYSKKKQQSAEFRTKEALTNLSDKGEEITVRSVARKAGVPVSYIYKYPELTYEIKRAREQQQAKFLTSDISASNTETRIVQLQQENQKLAKEIQVLKDSVKGIETNETSLKKLQQENTRLTIENQQLKQKLSYTQQKLHEAEEYILSLEYMEHNKL